MSIEQRGIRGGTRIPLELPVQIWWKSGAGIEQFAEGKTRSMSGNGLFITAAVRLRHNTPINFTVSLPTAVTHVPMQLLCEGRVVRQQRIGPPAGIGVIIDNYSLATMERPV